MKLYHYTTIDSLAQILNSRSLKFNRLDQLDDKTECEEFGLFNPLKYIFTSSFTGDKVENVALWKMYANMETGVRLEFDSISIFQPQTTKLPPHSFRGNFMPNSIWTAISSKDIINNDFILIFWDPLKEITICDGIHLRFVEYIDNIKEKYKKYIYSDPLNRTLELNHHDFGYYKSKYWEFQKEVRLLIYTIPHPHGSQDFDKLISNKKELVTTSIYVPISAYALNNLKIVLSPKVTEASRIIVKSLTSHLSNISIEDSVLQRVIR